MEINKPTARTITACAWSLSPIENVLDMKHSASTPAPFFSFTAVMTRNNSATVLYFSLSHQAPCCTSSYIYTGTRPWVTTLSIASKKTVAVLVFTKVQWCILSESWKNGFSLCRINCKTNQSFELMHCGVLAFIYQIWIDSVGKLTPKIYIEKLIGHSFWKSVCFQVLKMQSTLSLMVTVIKRAQLNNK